MLSKPTLQFLNIFSTVLTFWKKKINGNTRKHIDREAQFPFASGSDVAQSGTVRAYLYLLFFHLFLKTLVLIVFEYHNKILFMLITEIWGIKLKDACSLEEKL